MLGSVSCSDYLQETSDFVNVTFTTMFPAEVRANSYGNATQIDSLVVGIYDANKNEIGRRQFHVPGLVMTIPLQLAQDQTYNFIFWAYSSSCDVYDISDLTHITMGSYGDTTTFSKVDAADVFYAVKENVTVNNNITDYPVDLFRPLTQINVGTTSNREKATLTIKNAPNTFLPFLDSVGGSQDFVFNFTDTLSGTFDIGATSYPYMAMGYLFAPNDTISVSGNMVVTDTLGQTELYDFPNITLNANSRSNIVGGF